MSHLTWRESTPADRLALQQFTCTQPGVKQKRAPWKVIHPREWELSLQKEIHDSSPRCSSQRVVLLGEDEDGVAAVAVAESDRSATSLFVAIECVAVALRRRGEGGSCADEALQRVMEWAIERADLAGFDSVELGGKTHVRNFAGRRLVERHQFGYFGVQGEYEIWRARIAL